MKRLLNASLILMLVSYSAAFGWTRHVVALQEATKRAEVILIGRIKTDSIVRVTHPQRAGGGASWEHQAVLVVGGVMKGELTDKEIPIVIHYGIDPIVGRKLPDGKGGVVDDPVERASFSKDAIELYDNGGMRMRFTYDIREDHIWMLRHSDGSNRFDESINALGLWEPPDIQPMSQKQDVLKAICAN